MSIPGLLRIPGESSDPGDVINLVSFKSQPYTVPGGHRYGSCRPLTDFQKLSRIGEGSFGIVDKVKDKTNNHVYAMKKLKTSNKLELMPQNFQREITNLKILKHENIVNLLEVVVGEDFQSTCLILEYCKYCLSKVIDDDPSHLQRPQTKNIVHQLFSGLDFIHKHFIFHRDINPSNILFNEEGILKITDFGSSRKTTTKGNLTPNIGTCWYRAPEIWFGSVNYSTSVDIWSAGCIFAELLLQKVLFHADSDIHIIGLINHLLGSPTESEWPEHVTLPFFQTYNIPQQRFNRIRSTFVSESDATVSLIREIFIYNPLKRITAEKCLEHPYFSELPVACSPEDLLCVLEASEAI